MSDEPIKASSDAARAESISKMQKQLSLLQDAAEDLASTRTIDPEARAAAISSAEQLAQSVAALGFTSAAVRASEAVATLNHAGLPQPERFQQQVRALCDALAPVLKA